jgi:hypothetical protein
MPRVRWLLLILVAACEQPRGGAAPSATSAPSASAASLPTGDARATLDGLDARTALPLLPMMAHHQKQNMRDHLVAVQEIVAAVANEDLAAVERAAGRLGSSESMAQMCTHMGAGAAGFTERALEFHRTADTISVAARKGDSPAVLQALGKTLNACTGCHAAFKQQVVNEGTWSQITERPSEGH